MPYALPFSFFLSAFFFFLTLVEEDDSQIHGVFVCLFKGLLIISISGISVITCVILQYWRIIKVSITKDKPVIHNHKLKIYYFIFYEKLYNTFYLLVLAFSSVFIYKRDKKEKTLGFNFLYFPDLISGVTC